MPAISINVTDRHAGKLQAIVDRYNATNGTALTIDEWYQRNLEEIAVAEDLAAAIGRRRETDAEVFGEWQKGEQDRMIADLKRPLTPATPATPAIPPGGQP